MKKSLILMPLLVLLFTGIAEASSGGSGSGHGGTGREGGPKGPRAGVTSIELPAPVAREFGGHGGNG